ncbi:MAG TPA: NnrU family protein, partial [Caulobacteraceae bacterium]|nr:NnrU family protein [Caulobacteraceae bacterium]
SIDAKRRRALGATYEAFEAQTSNAPFGAIFAGRQKLSLGEIGWWKILLAIAIWAAVLFVHPIVFGVNPLA